MTATRQPGLGQRSISHAPDDADSESDVRASLLARLAADTTPNPNATDD